MKFKNDFITNSSSTSFIIKNTSDKKKTLVDFVKENPQLINDFVNMYYWHKADPEYTQENLIKSAKENNIIFKPDQVEECVFGDEQGSLIGAVFDYILRNGGKSKSFEWKFWKYYR